MITESPTNNKIIIMRPPSSLLSSVVIISSILQAIGRFGWAMDDNKWSAASTRLRCAPIWALLRLLKVA